MNLKHLLPFGIIALAIIFIFYLIYFTKMFLQKKQGIKTNQIGSRKEKKLHIIETLMAIATYSIVLVEVISIFTNFNYSINIIRIIGAILGFIGDLVFLLAITCMKDSWRAGIPKSDKTKLVTNGIYKISRNPAFLGFDLVYIGILLLYFNPIHLIFTLFAIIMLHLQILQEEKFMEATLNDEYVDYKKKVFRYLGRKF
ncbi:MAG: isoprenylcysteine carboxylmethyltransferase family protein [Candidatus Caccosoma sp.]|nr:isoprenylcysteine carboxylmethyltransferase family protein [Candidatus Caccosoma sp.]